MDVTLPFLDNYKVNLEAFEGPLDLLLHLIRKEEVDIYDIPIGRITSQYMAWLEQMQALDINVAGEFIVMASTLMLIKSRMLLPRDERKAEESEDDEIDPRLELVRQLVEYRKYKDAAGDFAAREQLQSAMYLRGAFEPPPPSDETALRLGDIGLTELMAAFQRVLEKAKATVSFGHLKQHTWSVPDQMRTVLHRITLSERMPFDALFPAAAPKGEVIVTFIAVLELLRLRHLRVFQEDAFGEIIVEPLPRGKDTHLPLPNFEELAYGGSSDLQKTLEKPEIVQTLLPIDA